MNKNVNQKPLILSVETSGRTGSVAIAQGPELLAEKAFTGPMRHSAELFPAVQKLLAQFGYKPPEIEQVYISVGPGSFTGLRIAVTMAKTMNLATETNIVAVDTLDVIACNASSYIEKSKNRIDKTAVILDAKRGQFFVAVYENLDGNWRKIVDDCLISSTDFIKTYGDTGPMWLLGEGLVYYKGKFTAESVRFLDEKYWNPRATNVHKLGWQKVLRGEFADVISLQPKYLRRPQIGVQGTQRKYQF